MKNVEILKEKYDKSENGEHFFVFRLHNDSPGLRHGLNGKPTEDTLAAKPHRSGSLLGAVSAANWRTSPFDSHNRPWSHARRFRGPALLRAFCQKANVPRAQGCRPVVPALVLDGRWSPEAELSSFGSSCAAARVPHRLCWHAVCVQQRSAALSFTAAKAFASTLLLLPLQGAVDVDEPPELNDLLQADRPSNARFPSRLPART